MDDDRNMSPMTIRRGPLGFAWDEVYGAGTNGATVYWCTAYTTEQRKALKQKGETLEPRRVRLGSARSMDHGVELASKAVQDFILSIHRGQLEVWSNDVTNPNHAIVTADSNDVPQVRWVNPRKRKRRAPKVGKDQLVLLAPAKPSAKS